MNAFITRNIMLKRLIVVDILWKPVDCGYTLAEELYRIPCLYQTQAGWDQEKCLSGKRFESAKSQTLFPMDLFPNNFFSWFILKYSWHRQGRPLTRKLTLNAKGRAYLTFIFRWIRYSNSYCKDNIDELKSWGIQ